MKMRTVIDVTTVGFVVCSASMDTERHSLGTPFTRATASC